MSTNEGKCVWKEVAKKDLEKLANGNSYITLSLDKPCYDCEGTEEYAKRIKCRAYVVIRGGN